MKRSFLAITGMSLVAMLSTTHAAHAAHAAHATTSQTAITQSYISHVYSTYSDTYETAKLLQKSVDAFLATPNDLTMAAAKKAWLASRAPYGKSEAFRFYEGPIDFVDAEGNEGPEGRLNAWPLDEAYIDYVQGNLTSGIVNNEGQTLTKEALKATNQADDEADVSTGYHAIEYLLWGQDLSLKTAGQRPASDYADTPKNKRRRTYLKLVTDLLVDDVETLRNAWEPNKANFGQSFLKDDKALSKIMTALATLSGFELAAERMATALDSGDQEDEHSCFSDNTHNDFIYNAAGISDVYFKTGIHGYVKAKDTALAATLEAKLKQTNALIAALPHPIDREILSTPEGSPARAQMEAAITSLQEQADLFKKAGEALGIEVSINE